MKVELTSLAGHPELKDLINLPESVEIPKKALERQLEILAIQHPNENENILTVRAVAHWLWTRHPEYRGKDPEGNPIASAPPSAGPVSETPAPTPDLTPTPIINLNIPVPSVSVNAVSASPGHIFSRDMEVWVKRWMIAVLVLLGMLVTATVAHCQLDLIQWQNSAGTVIATHVAVSKIKCSTNLTCTSGSGNLMTIVATNTGTTAWSGITAATNSQAGSFLASGNSWDWTGVTIFKLRTSAACTSSANGDLCYDSTNNKWLIWQGAANKNLIAASNLGTSGQPCLSNADGSCTFADPVVSQPTASLLNATVVGAGTAGTANAGVETVQGIAGMTKLLVTPDSVALPANQSVNVAQINGVTTLMGNGTTGTGSQRVTLASDNTGIANWGHGATGSAVPSGAHYVGVNDGTNLIGVKQASLANLTVATTLTARNSSGTILSEKGSRWMVVSQPAAGSQATASIAAEASVRHVVDCVAFSSGATTAPALTQLTINVRDGATGAGTIIWTYVYIVPAATGQNMASNFCGLGLVGTTNTAMTLEFSASLANLFESVSISGYNVN